jgi:hypothetical protein
METPSFISQPLPSSYMSNQNASQSTSSASTASTTSTTEPNRSDTSKTPNYAVRPVVQEIEDRIREEFSHSSLMELWERLQKKCFEVSYFVSNKNCNKNRKDSFHTKQIFRNL